MQRFKNWSSHCLCQLSISSAPDGTRSSCVRTTMALIAVNKKLGHKNLTWFLQIMDEGKIFYSNFCMITMAHEQCLPPMCVGLFTHAP